MRFSHLYRHIFLATVLAVSGCLAGASAQVVTPSGAQPVAANGPKTAPDSLIARPRYGVLSYDSLLTAMPEYVRTLESLSRLRQQYEKEAEYNASNFKRLFTEFLDGQKNFPKSILLKRQRDLQNEMERDLAFREQADSLLRAAEADLMGPVRSRLDAAIRAAGAERGYDFIINTDRGACPYYNPLLSEDAAPYVRIQLNKLRP